MKNIRLFLFLLLFGMPTFAQAQSNFLVQKWNLVEAQSISNLESTIPAIKAQTFKNTIIFATLYRESVSLQGLQNSVRFALETGSDTSQRLLAIAALQSIGNSETSDFLSRSVTEEEFEEGRITMASVVNDYYLTHTSEKVQ